MTVREKKLLGLLGWTGLACACALLAAAGAESLREVSASLEAYRTRLERMESRASEDPALLDARIRELKEIVERLEARGSARPEGEGDLADFGSAVRRELRAAGASVLRYQPPGEPGTDILEFAARGSPLALVRFLRAAADRGWSVLFLSVRSESADGPAEFILRIGHDD